MELTILMLWGFVMFIDTMFDKWSIWYNFELFTENQTRSRWLYSLGQCRFCCLFWLTFIIWIWCVITGVLEFATIPVVFVVSGLNSIKHNKI